MPDPELDSGECSGVVASCLSLPREVVRNDTRERWPGSQKVMGTYWSLPITSSETQFAGPSWLKERSDSANSPLITHALTYTHTSVKVIK